MNLRKIEEFFGTIVVIVFILLLMFPAIYTIREMYIESKAKDKLSCKGNEFLNSFTKDKKLIYVCKDKEGKIIFF